MRYLLFYIFCCLTTTLILAQNITLNIQTTSGDGIPQVKAILKNISYTSDIRGRIQFNAELPVQFRMYHPDFTSKDTLITSYGEHQIVLTRKHLVLDEVLIDEDKKWPSFMKKLLNQFQTNYAGTQNYRGEGINDIKKNNANKWVLDELFLTQHELSVNHSQNKEKITQIVHFNKNTNDAPLQQNQRWQSGYALQNKKAPQSFPLLGNEVNDFISNFNEQQFQFPEISNWLFKNPLHPKNSNSWVFNNHDVLVVNNTLVEQISFSCRTKDTDQLSGKIYWQSSDLQLFKIELDFPLNSLGHNLEYCSIVIEFSTQFDPLLIKKLQADFNSKQKKQHSVFKLNPITHHLKFPPDVVLLYDLSLDKEQKWELPTALDDETLSFIHEADSILAFKQSPKYLHYLDSLHNHQKLWDILFNGYVHHNHTKGYRYWIAPIQEQLQILGIGGYRQALEGIYSKQLKKERSLQLAAQGDYGFNNQDFTGRVRMQYVYSPIKMAYWDIALGSKYQLLTYELPLQSLISRGNYVLNNYVQASHFFEIINGLTLNTQFKFSDRKSIAHLKLERWSTELFGEDNIPQEFDAYKESLFTIGINYTPFQKYERFPNSKRILGAKYPTLFTQMQVGIPQLLNSTVDFSKVTFGLQKKYQNKIGKGSYEIAHTQFLHFTHLEFPNYNFIQGTTPFVFFSPLYTFQLLPQTIQTLADFTAARWYQECPKNWWINLSKNKQLIPAYGAGFLAVWETQATFHQEVFYGVQIPFKISKSNYQLGVFHCLSVWGSSTIHQVKIGLNIYNNFTRQWLY